MKGERKREGRAGGQQAAAHQSHSIYTHLARWAWATAQKIDLRHHTPRSLSSWKAALRQLLIDCLPAFSSGCLEAASSMKPPSGPVSLPG